MAAGHICLTRLALALRPVGACPQRRHQPPRDRFLGTNNRDCPDRAHWATLQRGGGGGGESRSSCVPPPRSSRGRVWTRVWPCTAVGGWVAQWAATAAPARVVGNHGAPARWCDGPPLLLGFNAARRRCAARLTVTPRRRSEGDPPRRRVPRERPTPPRRAAAGRHGWHGVARRVRERVENSKNTANFFHTLSDNGTPALAQPNCASAARAQSARGAPVRGIHAPCFEISGAKEYIIVGKGPLLWLIQPWLLCARGRGYGSSDAGQ